MLKIVLRTFGTSSYLIIIIWIWIFVVFKRNCSPALRYNNYLHFYILPTHMTCVKLLAELEIGDLLAAKNESKLMAKTEIRSEGEEEVIWRVNTMCKS